MSAAADPPFQDSVSGGGSSTDNVCLGCSQTFKSRRGVAIHQRKSPNDACRRLINTATIDRAAGPPDVPVIPASTDSDGVECCSVADRSLSDDVERWSQRFIALRTSGTTATEFSATVREYHRFLYTANERLSGPTHPGVAYQRKRKWAGEPLNRRGYRKSSNPARASGRDKQRNRDRYFYELAQWNYYNRRRRVAQQVLQGSAPAKCSRTIGDVESHFKGIFEAANDAVRDSYDGRPTIDDPFELDVSVVSAALKGMSIDTAAGPDGVLLRTVKSLNCAPAILAITQIMLEQQLVPDIFRLGRTVLIAKNGSSDDLGHWRPITIFPILRRVSERILDNLIRARVQSCRFQRGFVNLPGTHINASLIDHCLRRAKREKGDCCIAFLDVSKAFDSVGHEHIRRTLDALPLPSSLRGLLFQLLSGNSTRVSLNREATENISFCRGVAQGSPLAPTLFNLAIDFILKDAGHPDVASAHGINLVDGLLPVSVLGFADDMAAAGRDESGCRRICEIIIDGLRSIGLKINDTKSAIINVKSGKLCRDDLILSGGMTLRALASGEQIKYLGVTFKDEIVFDKEKFLSSLIKDLDSLVSSPLLQPDQKLNILNQYIWPKLVYPLQTAPTTRLSQSFLDQVDVVIRQHVRTILEIPSDCPNAMLYAPRKLRGLAILCAAWEAGLQSFAISISVQRAHDPHLDVLRDFEDEQEAAKMRLGVPGSTSKELRAALREEAFMEWCRKPLKGLGVEQFRDNTRSNSWVTNKADMSGSEWRTGLKLNCNSTATRATPGRGSTDPRCRHSGCSERETLPHVLGICRKGELLRLTRHHRVRTAVADLFRGQQLDVFEEVHCQDPSSGNRRADIVVVDRRRKSGLILDPTVRFENNNPHQASDVDVEKKAIYEPCIPFFRARYGIAQWQVVGLLFGARGSASTFLTGFFREQRLPSKSLDDICHRVLLDSIGILHHHIRPTL